MPELFETAIVEKRNLLNELRTSLNSTQELRLFSVYLSKIDPYDPSTRIVRFSLSDFQRIMNFEQLNIARLKASATKVLHSEVFLPKESGGFKGINLFETFDVDKDSNGVWYVEINPTQTALPLLFGFKDKYFKYELWNALRLKAPSQIRMYEILKQYEKLGKREIEVNKLQELLGVNYARWDRFKAKVLDNCQKALKEVTDICYTYERGKTGAGGKWLTIIFYIKKNNDYIDPLTLDEFIDQNSNFTSSEFDFADDLDEDDIRLAKYGGDEYLATLAEAVNDEFSKEDMEQIRYVLTRIDIPEDNNLSGNEAVLWGRHQYLKEKYAVLNAEDARKKSKNDKIGNRFKYFLGMLEKDTFKPAVYNAKGE